MPGTQIDIARLISDHWIKFSADEQAQIEQRIHDLVLLSLANALDAAVLPVTVQESARVPGPLEAGAAKRQADTEAALAAVPFGDASNYRDYTYDDFATLAEAHGVPPVSAVGHWFGKTYGIEFDKSTPELRRKVYSEMLAFYATKPEAPAPLVQLPAAAMAVAPRPPYAPDVNLNLCPSCAQAAKYVAAGVSNKTGKRYSAFYACGKRPPCQSHWKAGKDLTWTTDSDWLEAYGKAHAA